MSASRNAATQFRSPAVKAGMEHKGQKFDARLIQYLGKKLDKMDLKTEAEAE